MNGYNFTERVRKVLVEARNSAGRLRHEYVGTEHILLGLIHEGQGIGATVLQNLGVDLQTLEMRIEEIVKKGAMGTRSGPDLPYTSRAKKVLDLAMNEARELNHSYVGTEHLLLGLIREAKGIGAQVLVDSGVTMDAARNEVLRILNDTSPSSPPQRVTKPREPGNAANWTPDGEPTDAVPERVHAVMEVAKASAGEDGVTTVLPAHIAIALLQHGEGFANAVLDRLGVDRAALIRELKDTASHGAPAAIPAATITFGQDVIALEKQIDGESRWRSTPVGTIHVLLALLDTRPEIAAALAAQGIDANRVRTEAKRITG